MLEFGKDLITDTGEFADSESKIVGILGLGQDLITDTGEFATSEHLNKIPSTYKSFVLTLVLLNLALFIFENTVDPDLMASDEAIRSGSTLFSLYLYIHVIIGMQVANRIKIREECSS